MTSQSWTMERDHHPTLPVVLITWCLSVGSISRALAESQVIGSPQPIIAVAGDDVILPCSLEPPINAEQMTVEWSRPGMKPEYVHVYRDGRNLVVDQNPSYKTRTFLFEGELINGSVSLKLFRVKLEDQGNYTCRIPSLNSLVTRETVIQLTVVVVSEPKISILGAKGAGVVLQCESKSWFPEPQLEWREGPKDSEGRLLSADVTQRDREPDGRYTVRSNVTVQKTDTNMFTCRVQLMKFNLKKEAEIHVNGSLFQLTEYSSRSRLVVGVSVGVLVVFLALIIVGAAVFLYRRRQKKSKRADSNRPDIERGGEQGTNEPGERDDQMLSEETRAEIETCLLWGSEPDTRRTNGGPREGEDSGWASRAASNANSTRDSLVSEHIELSLLSLPKPPAV